MVLVVCPNSPTGSEHRSFPRGRKCHLKLVAPMQIMPQWAAGQRSKAVVFCRGEAACSPPPFELQEQKSKCKSAQVRG